MIDPSIKNIANSIIAGAASVKNATSTARKGISSVMKSQFDNVETAKSSNVKSAAKIFGQIALIFASAIMSPIAGIALGSLWCKNVMNSTFGKSNDKDNKSQEASSDQATRIEDPEAEYLKRLEEAARKDTFGILNDKDNKSQELSSDQATKKDDEEIKNMKELYEKVEDLRDITLTSKDRIILREGGVGFAEEDINEAKKNANKALERNI